MIKLTPENELTECFPVINLLINLSVVNHSHLRLGYIALLFGNMLAGKCIVNFVRV
jgi:hypothetical protein